MSEYPRITQEELKSASHIVLNALKDPNYLLGAPYSAPMLKTMNEIIALFRKEIMQGKVSSGASPISDEEKERLIAAEIKEQFGELAEDLENRSDEYRDKFGILIRLEKTIRTVSNMVKQGNSDQVKMSAATKLMDFQDQQVKTLSQLLDIERTQRIESITRRFFTELRNHPDLKIVADRYLDLLKAID